MHLYKYPIDRSHGRKNALVRLPRGAQILSVVLDQDDIFQCYALVDPTQPIIPVPMQCLWTGDTLDRSGAWMFLGTLRTSDALMWHVFCPRGTPHDTP